MYRIRQLARYARRHASMRSSSLYRSLYGNRCDGFPSAIEGEITGDTLARVLLTKPKTKKWEERSLLPALSYGQLEVIR